MKIEKATCMRALLRMKERKKKENNSEDERDAFKHMLKQPLIRPNYVNRMKTTTTTEKLN